MMSRITCAFALCLAVLVTASPGLAEKKLDLERLRIPHEKFVLDNGLTVIVHEDHSVPIVAVNLWYHVGSRYEERGRTGFAHLFEHFFFNGSENYPHGFREAMDDIGANNRNGTTNPDRTNFFEDVPTSGLERTLYLEADRMGFLAGNLSAEMLERERGVVQNEKRQRENQPYGRVFTRVVEAVYPYSHPYSWSTIGKMADLQAATLDDVKEWYRKYYGPNNCVLSLAGDVTVERARELVAKYFGAIPPGPPIDQHEQWVPRLDGNLRESMEDRVPQARIYRVYHVPGWSDPDLPLLQLATGALSGSKSSRLDRRLVYDKELVTDVAAFIFEREIAGGFFVMATVKAGVDPALVEKEIDAVINEYLEKGPTEDELQRSRTREVAGFIRGIERLGGFGGRSDVLAESMTYGGRPDAYLDRFRRMLEATPEQVRQTSRKWLDAHHYTMTVKPFPELASGEEKLDRSVLPALSEPPEVRFPEVQSHLLSNGLGVLLLERHTAPMVNMSLVVDAGYAADPADRAGIASLALELMEEGTKSRDAFRIADDLDALGAEIGTASSLDQSLVRLRALSMNLGASLDLFADVVLNPSFPEEMVQLGKRRRIARIGQEKAQPIAAAMRIAPRLLYGEDHAYSLPMTGSGYEETVSRITRKHLADWHATWFRPNNAKLVVVGDTTLEQLAPQLERAFGSWKRGKSPTKNVGTVQAKADKRIYLIDKPDAEQSVIVASQISREGGQPEELAIETVMRLFGGMSTSRLNRNLRLDKHWSYGVRGMLMDARGPRPFTVIAPVQTDKTKESMAELVTEIRGIAGKRPVQGEEFESIKRNMVLRLPGRFETLRSLQSATEELVNFGYPPEYYYEYARNVRKLTEQDLNAAAAKFIDPDRLTWIVIGDLSKIESGIRELGYGEVTRIEAN